MSYRTHAQIIMECWKKSLNVLTLFLNETVSATFGQLLHSDLLQFFFWSRRDWFKIPRSCSQFQMWPLWHFQRMLLAKRTRVSLAEKSIASDSLVFFFFESSRLGVPSDSIFTQTQREERKRNGFENTEMKIHSRHTRLTVTLTAVSDTESMFE